MDARRFLGFYMPWSWNTFLQEALSLASAKTNFDIGLDIGAPVSLFMDAELRLQSSGL